MKRVDVPGQAGCCGPVAIASITGRPAELWIHRMSGKRVKRGMKISVMDSILHGEFGSDRVVFRRFYRSACLGSPQPMLWQLVRAGKSGVAWVRGHFLAIEDFLVCDTKYGGRPHWVMDSPHARQRVKGVWWIAGSGH